MFILAPRAGKELIGSAQIGEYFRVFVSYGINSLSSYYAPMEKRERKS